MELNQEHCGCVACVVSIQLSAAIKITIYILNLLLGPAIFSKTWMSHFQSKLLSFPFMFSSQTGRTFLSNNQSTKKPPKTMIQSERKTTNLAQQLNKVKV